jgi:hypothetical protein
MSKMINLSYSDMLAAILRAAEARLALNPTPEAQTAKQPTVLIAK